MQFELWSKLIHSIIPDVSFPQVTWIEIAKNFFVLTEIKVTLTCSDLQDSLGQFGPVQVSSDCQF